MCIMVSCGQETIFYWAYERGKKMEKKNDLLLDIHDKPVIWKWILLSFQHVFAMFGATVLVPLLVNNAVGEEILPISVALVSSGIGTLIYIVCTKTKSPIYLGSSFAYITPMISVAGAALASGGDPKAAVFTGIMLVGLVYVVIAGLVAVIGKDWIDKVLPPVVIGPMIAIIGLGLAPTAVSQIGISAGTKIDFARLSIGVVSMLVTALCAIKGKGMLKVVPFLVGITSGYIWALVIGMFGWTTAIDFTGVTNAAFFGIPNFYVPGINYSLDFSGLFTIAPIAIVTVAEHIGDHTVLSAIMKRNLLKDPGLNRTILGDGLATFLAGAIGGPANTSYGENTSVIGMTKVASVYVTGLAALFAIGLGFAGKFIAIIQTIPTEVFGGVCILLYGFIASNGLKVLIDNQVDFGKTKNVVVASTMLVLGLGGANIDLSIASVTISLSGMVLAAICGITLNLVFNIIDKD